GPRGSDCEAVAFGVIRTSKDLPLPERLGRLQTELEALIDEVRPSAVAVERVLFQVNVRTAMSVGQARGLALATEARAGLPLEQVTRAFLLTHLLVREDAMTRYGFPTRDERDTFEALIGASGVGPKLGLAMLSVHPPSMLRRCVADDDVDSLCLVPGVGKRTA